MKHKFTKKISFMLTCIMLITIILSHAKTLATSEISTDNDTKQEMAEDSGILKLHTIDELVFNKIPVLDVNVFSNTAGGQTVREGSTVYKIRQSIATWYVSFRNLVTIVLAIIIVYIGIRMSISTIAEQKANYKKMIIGWITAIIIVYFIHYAMMIVLNINDSLVNIFAQNSIQSEVSMYETIRTRTQDIRASVGFPALVIYAVLVIYFIMFLWVYIKRYFTILILIIVAPIIGVKYAIDSTSKGKKGKVFAGWMYEFTMNVLLQSMHALIYTVIMKIAIDLAQVSIFGYIIALVFLNFILKSDKIFMNIFNFKKSKTAMEASEPMTDPKKVIAPALFVGGITKDFFGGAWDLAVWGERKARRGGHKLYNYVTDKYDQKNGGDIKEDIKEKKNEILNKYDETINSIYKKARGKDSEYRILAIMSRRKGATGKAAKKTLKKAKQNRKAKFTAPFKFITSAGGNVLKIVGGVPLAVVNPGAGTGFIISGVKGTIDMATKRDNKGNKYKGKEALAQALTLGEYGTEKQIKKNDKKISKTIKYLKDASDKEDEIEKMFIDKFGEELTKEAKQYKSDISYILSYGDKDNIHMILRERLSNRNMFTIDDSNIDKVIDTMADDIFTSIDIGGQYSLAISNKIKEEMKQKAKGIYNTKKTDIEKSYGAEDMAQGFAEAILEKGIRKGRTEDGKRIDYEELTNKFVELHEINQRARKDVDTSVVREKQFIKSLNKKKGSSDSEDNK